MVEVFAASPLDSFSSNLDHSTGDGVRVEILENHGMVQVFAAKGKTLAVERTLKIKESPGKATSLADFTAIPVSPGQWFLVSGKPDTKDTFANDISVKLKKTGYLSEQSDARVIFRISGPRTVELMQKGCRLDLHPDKTGKDWCAQTQMAQIGVIIHQIAAKPTFDLFVYSGFAREFAEWLSHTGAQLGMFFQK